MNNPGSLVPVAIGGLAFIKEYIPLPDEEASDPDADVERDATAGTEAAEVPGAAAEADPASDVCAQTAPDQARAHVVDDFIEAPRRASDSRFKIASAFQNIILGPRSAQSGPATRGGLGRAVRDEPVPFAVQDSERLLRRFLQAGGLHLLLPRLVDHRDRRVPRL